jgi:hypothetical protein
VSAFCKYCAAEVDHRPYAYKRDMPSVTGVLSMLDAGKSRAFGWAAAMIAATTAIHEPERWADLGTDGCTHDKDGLCPACRFVRSEFDRQWTAKADLGTHVHHCALSWATGEDVDADDVTSGFLDGLEKFYVEHNPEWVELERTVRYDREISHAYRGQFDGICDIDVAGERRRMLIDIKTGRYSPHTQALQLAAYRYASLTRWDDKTETVEGKVPTVAGCAVLLLSADGTYRLIELPAAGDEHSTFLRLRDIWGWNKTMDRWARENPSGIEQGEQAA